MQRLYEDIMIKHFFEDRQMLFFMGPRQVGKTTVIETFGKNHPPSYYLNWDNEDHRLLIMKGPGAVATFAHLATLQELLPIILFDEIHKYEDWKGFLKGFFDTYGQRCSIVVTGSAKLDVFQKGGDSLMGRYFPYHFYPLTVAEILRQQVQECEVSPPQRIDADSLEALWEFGGFPEPFVKRNVRFYQRWKILRQRQLIRGDIRDLTQIQDLDKIELLAEIIRGQSGQLLTFHSIAKKIRASDNSVRQWLSVLRNLYYCFAIPPYAKNLSRALTKEPKYYLWDWALVEDEGARFENLVAVHLRKAIHLWTDYGLGEYELYFIRDREKKEVDFLVTRNKTPWFLVEAKKNDNKGISPSLHYFFDRLQPQNAFQVVWNLPFVEKDCFTEKQPIIVPATTLLSQLV